jgi:hypothetical protein
MSDSSARAYWVRPMKFPADIRCAFSRGCSQNATFQVGWRYDRKIMGKLTELPAARPSCEKHARFFAQKKGVKIKGTAA